MRSHEGGSRVNSNAVLVACLAAVAVLGVVYLGAVGGSMAEQDKRNECMSALSTPGVSDPEYNEKSVEFAQGLADCMEGE